MRSTPYAPLRIAVVTVAVFLVAYALLGSDGWGPRAPNEQAIGAVSRWCERVAGGLLREPVNALANVGFVLAGLAMFRVLGRDDELARPRPNPFVGQQPTALLYAAATTLLGPGSMLMHGTHLRVGAWLDNVSMVAYALVPWLVNVGLLARWRTRTTLSTHATLLALYATGYWFVGPDLGIGLDLFGASVGVWVVSEVLYRWWSPAARAWSGLVGFAVGAAFGVTPAVVLAAPGEHWWVVLFWLPGLLADSPPPGRRRFVPWFWLGAAAFVVAYAIWRTGTADDPRCEPDSLVQAHAIWHLLCALATWAFFLHFRTEVRVASARADATPTAAVMGRESVGPRNGGPWTLPGGAAVPHAGDHPSPEST